MDDTQMNGDSAMSYVCNGCGHDVPLGNKAIHSLRCSHSQNIPCSTGEAEEVAATTSLRASHPVSTSALAPPAETFGLRDLGISHHGVEQQPQRSGGPSDLDGEEKVAESSIPPQWACHACTYLNDMNRDKCELCLTRRRELREEASGSTRPPVSCYRETMLEGPGTSGTPPSVMEDAMIGAVLGGLTGGILSSMNGTATGMVSSVLQGALLGGSAGVFIRQHDRQTRWHRNQDAGLSSVPTNDDGGGVGNNNHSDNQAAAGDTLSGLSTVARRRGWDGGTVTYYSTNGGRRGVVTHTFNTGGGGGCGISPGIVTPLGVILQNMAMGSSATGNDYEQLLSIFGPPVTRGADSSSIRSLPTNRLTQDDVNRLPKDHQTCSICLSTFEAGDEARRLPCFHVFHSSCIDPWLGQNAKCPICMHEVDL